MDPINYLAAIPQEDFLRDIQGGFQLGAGIRQIQQQQMEQQLAQQQAAQYQADVNAFTANPSAQAAAALALKWPQQREAAKQAWDQQDAALRKSQGDAALQVGFALESGNPDVAKQLLQDRISALQNSGQDSSHEKLILGAIDTHPDAVKAELLKWAAFTQDPEKFAENFGKLGREQREQQTAPDMARKATADADTAEAEAKIAGVKAKYADQGALLDLQKKGWDIEAIKTDNEYKRQQTKVAYLNAALGRETNDLKRQELQLKVQDAVRERDDKLRAKVADAESAAANIDNMLNTIKRVQAHPALKDVVGSIEGRDLYPNTLAAAATTATPYGLFSTSGDERADAIALINTLGSQAFLSQVPTMKGQGSLSNAEGEKLQAALTNLSRKQSEGQFNANLTEAARILTKARGTVSKRYGVPLGNPDTPASTDNRPPLSSFYR